MSKSEIPWCDEGWPVVTGCTKISEGCTNCYACRLAATRLKHLPQYKGLALPANANDRDSKHERIVKWLFAKNYNWTGEVRLHPELLDAPLHWKRPRKVFVCPTADLFHPDVDADFITSVYDVMQAAKQHSFIVLTKRPERIVPVLYGEAGHWYMGGGDYLPNVWHMTTVENQEQADKRIPHLLKLRQAHAAWPVLGVSAEPLLGPVDLHLKRSCWHCGQPEGVPGGKFGGLQWGDGQHFHEDGHSYPAMLPPASLDWIIVGGETGPNARPMHPDWVRSLRDQAQSAGVAFFLKSLGEWHWRDGPSTGVSVGFRHGEGFYRVGKRAAGNTLDGRTWQEWPKEVLR